MKHSSCPAAKECIFAFRVCVCVCARTCLHNNVYLPSGVPWSLYAEYQCGDFSSVGTDGRTVGCLVCKTRKNHLASQLAALGRNTHTHSCLS